MNIQTSLKQLQGQYLFLLIEECREVVEKAQKTPSNIFITKDNKKPFSDLGLALKTFLSDVDNQIGQRELADILDISFITISRILSDPKKEGYRKTTINDFINKVENLVIQEFGEKENFINNELEVIHAWYN